MKKSQLRDNLMLKLNNQNKKCNLRRINKTKKEKTISNIRKRENKIRLSQRVRNKNNK